MAGPAIIFLKTKIIGAIVMKKNIFFAFTLTLIIAIVSIGALSSCSEAERQSTKISREADNFETPRRLRIINTRNDKIILEFTGTFSIQSSNGDIDILCSIGDDRYEKHFFKLNEWTIYTVEDMSNQNIDKYFKEIKYYPENK